MKYITTTLLSLYFLLSGCGSSDPYIHKLAQDLYALKKWQPPLPPHEFKSDGCSFWPDSNFLECCVEHDALYWMGGSSEERMLADLALKNCVNQKGHPIISKIMYYGVRVGGIYWLPTSFRWGFGWNYPQSGPLEKQF